MYMNEIVSVIIPNYNGVDTIRRCIDSVQNQSYKNIEIIVIDSKSTDNSVEIIKRGYSNVVLIENPYNAGWGIACNVGIRKAKGDYYLILNNDAWMSPDCARELLKGISRDEKYGACASKILLGENNSILDVAGGLLIFKDGLSVGRGHLELSEEYNKEEEVFCANDCCCLFRKEMFDDIGFYDDDFFIYADETDIGWKAQLTGWKCVYNPKAIAYHGHVNTEERYSSDFKAFYVERNRLFITFKYFPWFLIFVGYGYSFLRYSYQVYYAYKYKGATGKYIQNNSLSEGFLILLKAHIAAYSKFPRMLKKRMAIMKKKKISNSEIYGFFNKFGVSIKDIAQYG